MAGGSPYRSIPGIYDREPCGRSSGRRRLIRTRSDERMARPLTRGVNGSAGASPSRTGQSGRQDARTTNPQSLTCSTPAGVEHVKDRSATRNRLAGRYVKSEGKNEEGIKKVTPPTDRSPSRFRKHRTRAGAPFLTLPGVPSLVRPTAAAEGRQTPAPHAFERSADGVFSPKQSCRPDPNARPNNCCVTRNR